MQEGGNFELDAKMGGVGVTAGISFEIADSHGVAIFAMAKRGLIHGARIGGQKLAFEAR